MIRPMSVISAVSLLTAMSGAAQAETFTSRSHESVSHSTSDGIDETKTIQIESDLFDGLPISITTDATSEADSQRIQELHDIFNRILLELRNDAEGDEEDDEDIEDDEDEDEDEDDEENDDDETAEDSYEAEITPEQSVTPVTSTGSGMGEFSLRGNNLHYTITAENLSSPVIAAHFHHAPSGQTGAVIEPIATMTGFTFFSGSGTWMEMTEEELEWLDDEEIYVNIHTVNHPAGELRGQIED